MISDINGTLLRHLATGAGAAYRLRIDCPKLREVVASFFQTRTDIKRLTAAQEVAKEILLRNDHQDMLEIRDIVAKQELRRQIRYGNQQDHTAHTVYLYLLGLWLYDNLPQITTAIAEQYRITEGIDSTNQHWDPDVWFLQQWSFASLLHDVGYAFHTLDVDTREDRKQIDSVYSLAWVRRQYSNLSQVANDALAQAFAAWSNAYEKVMRPGTASYANDAFVEVIERLAQAPWLGDLTAELGGKDIFDVLDASNWGLREYTREVATNGYGGKGPCVDHAVASGLFLFQYSSFWYWLMKYVHDNTSEAIYRELIQGFNYNPIFVGNALPVACRAVAFHNIQPRVGAASNIIPQLCLDKEPLTFLAILGDELQRWDRYPAGSTYLDHYRVFAETALESDDVEISCNGYRNNYLRVLFRIRPPKAEGNNMDILTALRETLESRLPEYHKVLQI
jgi:hypothetical protein